MHADLSLRSRLLLLVGLPLLLLILIETVVSYLIGVSTANQVFDSWLLDSANSLAEEVREEDGSFSFLAQDEALDMFEWDELDDTYFQVSTPDGRLIAGSLALPLTADLDRLRLGPIFEDQTLDGRAGRSVTILKNPGTAGEMVIQVTETLNKRSRMTHRVTALVLIKKGVMLVATLLAVAYAINRGIRPLRDLVREIGRRSARDLTPISTAPLPSELRELVGSTNQLLGRLEHALSAHEQFLGNIAHQIRTPLAGMKLQAQLGLRETEPERVRHALNQICRAADHMNHLNTQLMKLARAAIAFDRGPESSRFDLVEVIRECCARLIDKARSKDIELVFDVPQTPVLILGETLLLSEMVVNLIDNAILYGDPGGHVWVHLEQAGSGVKLVVEDDGPGIAEEHRPQIFDHFFRPPNSPGEGSGLGLPIVREIALAHGADLRLEERAPERGTRFVIVFPESLFAPRA